MITENLSTLKIHKLTQEQYERELEAGRIDPSALYLTPEEDSPNIYIQNEEPVDVEDGSLWVDMDAEGTISGSGGNVLIVNLTVDESSMYGSLVASHSASEIKAYLESGSTVIGRLNNSDLLLCMTNEDWGDSENYVGFLSSGLNGGENYYYKVRDDKSVYRVKYTHRHSEYIQSVNGVKPDSNGNVEITIPGSGGNVDLTGYATEEWVQEGYQPKGEYLTEVPEGYATETFVTEKIAEAELGGGGDGLVIQSKNLINPDEITEGYYIATNGELAAAETVKITGYIEVKPNTNYVYSHNSTKYDGAVDYGLYDSDKNF